MSQLTSTFEPTATRGDRRRPNISSLPLVTAGVMLLLMGGLFLAYFFTDPPVYGASDVEPEVTPEVREYAVPEAFAIQIRNEAMGGPYAVLEQARAAESSQNAVEVDFDAGP